jgi:hypothetical protein
MRWRQKSPLERIVHYRNRAEELRLIAEYLERQDCRLRVLQTAETYLDMAQAVEDSITLR